MFVLSKFHLTRFACVLCVCVSKQIGCTALLLASKYEEMYSPEVNDFVVVAASAYTRQEVLAMESIMLAQLEFNLTIPTAYRFAQRYSRVNRAAPLATAMAQFLVELTLQEYKMLKHLPSMIAASAVFLAQLMTTGAANWVCSNSTLICLLACSFSLRFAAFELS